VLTVCEDRLQRRPWRGLADRPRGDGGGASGNGSGAAGADRSRPQQPDKACLPGADRAARWGGVGLDPDRPSGGKSEPPVRRWLARFAAAGVAGLLRDATRPPGRKPLAKSVVEHNLPQEAPQDFAEAVIDVDTES
jgi:hypothetical protein